LNRLSWDCGTLRENAQQRLLLSVNRSMKFKKIFVFFANLLVTSGYIMSATPMMSPAFQAQ